MICASFIRIPKTPFIHAVDKIHFLIKHLRYNSPAIKDLSNLAEQQVKSSKPKSELSKRTSRLVPVCKKDSLIVCSVEVISCTTEFLFPRIQFAFSKKALVIILLALTRNERPLMTDSNSCLLAQKYEALATMARRTS